MRNEPRCSLAPRSHRQTYFPEEFVAGPASVAGERVLLIDDSWVSGATVVSAAGALAREGAESLAIFVVARVVNGPGQWHHADHPYFEALEREYDISHWPR